MRTRNALLNFVTLITFTVVTIFVGLFTSPLLERWLNPSRFGAYRLLIDCQGYLTLMELGLGGALSPLLARAFARGDESGLKQAMAVAVQAYLAISAATVAVGAAATLIVPYFVHDLSPAYLLDFRRAWLVGLLSFLSLALIPFRTIIEARQLGYYINLLLTGQAVFVTTLSLIFARSGWGITGQALASVLGTWGFSIVVTFMVLKNRPALLWSWRTPTDSSMRQSLGSLSAATFMINLSGRVSLMTDNLVVGSMLGTGLVTSLFFTQRLALLTQTLLGGVGSSIWAPLAELHSRGDHEAFNRRLIELSRLVAILSLTALGPIVAYNRHFVNLWMGPTFPYGGDSIIILAAFNAFLLAQFALWGWCFSGTGQIQKVVIASIVSAVVNITASITMTHWLGLVGPLLGTTISFLTVSLWCLPLLLHRVFGISIRELAISVGVPLAWGLLLAIGLWWVAHQHVPRGWVGLIVEMSLGAAAYIALFGAIVMWKTEERALWRLRVRAILGRS